MHKFIIEFGDYSRDGHGQSESIEFVSNYSLKQVQKSYAQMTHKYPVLAFRNIAGDYEDYSASPELVKFIKETMNLDPDKVLMATTETESKYGFEYIDHYAEFWMTCMNWFDPFCNLSLPDSSTKTPVWSTGWGYGMLGN